MSRNVGGSRIGRSTDGGETKATDQDGDWHTNIRLTQKETGLKENKRVEWSNVKNSRARVPLD